MTPAWLKAGIYLFGVLSLVSYVSLRTNPTVEGSRRRKRVRVGIRVLETPDEVSRARFETGWHWFARQYTNGKFSPPWHTTRDAARRGMSTVRATLWGWDPIAGKWVTDSHVRAGRIIGR